MLPVRAGTRPLVPVAPMKFLVAPVVPEITHNVAEAMVAVVVEVVAEAEAEAAPKRGQALEPEMEISA